MRVILAFEIKTLFKIKYLENYVLIRASPYPFSLLYVFFFLYSTISIN